MRRAKAAERLSERDEEEIRWALCLADGEMGVRSNFLGVVSRIELGTPIVGGPVRTDLPDAAVEAAGRERAVRRVLERMRREDRRVLERWCGPASGLRLAAWGRLTCLVPLTGAASRVAPEDAGEVWLAGVSWEATREGGAEYARVWAVAMRMEAEEMLRTACAEWEAARRR